MNFHYVKKFSVDESSLDFKLIANTVADLFTILNGNVVNLTVSRIGLNSFRVVHDFKAYDVFEAYAYVDMIQPESFEFSKSFKFLSRALAQLKRLEYGIYETQYTSEVYTLTENYLNIIDNALTLNEILVFNSSGLILNYTINDVILFITKSIKNNAAINLHDVRGSNFLVLTRPVNGSLNLMGENFKIIHASTVFNRKIKHKNFNIFFVNGAGEYNVYDFCGANYSAIGDFHFPMNPFKELTRTYAISGGSFIYVLPQQGAGSYTIFEKDGVILKNSQTLTEGTLISKTTQNLNYSIRTGLLDNQDDTINDTNQDIEGLALPDFEIPISNSLKYFGVDIVSNETDFVIGVKPIERTLNLIASPIAFNKIVYNGGVKFVTKHKITTKRPIGMTWSGDVVK